MKGGGNFQITQKIKLYSKLLQFRLGILFRLHSSCQDTARVLLRHQYISFSDNVRCIGFYY